MEGLKMRKDIINIVNTLAAGAGLDFHIIETYNAIFNYCKEHKKQPRKMCFDAAADFYENKILSKQETYTL
jgi:hypothetical protein